MDRKILFCVVFISAVSLIAQDLNLDLQVQHNRFRTSSALLGIGIGASILGTGIALAGVYKRNQENLPAEEQHPATYIGALVLAGGIGMLIPGAIFRGKSRRAIARLQEKADENESRAEQGLPPEPDPPLNRIGLKVTTPNYAGGVGVFVGFTNQSGKRIKYVHFTVSPYNRVADPVYDSIDRTSRARLELVGPIEPGKTVRDRFYDVVWYNSTVEYAILETIEIEYMDGTHETMRPGLRSKKVNRQ